MGQYSDIIRTINNPFTDGATSNEIRDSFDMASPSGNAPHVTHLTFFFTNQFDDATANPLGTIDNAITRLKIQVGANVLMDYTSPLTTVDPDNPGISPLGVLLQKVGGISYLYPFVQGTDTYLTSMVRIPLGIAFNGNQSKRVNILINTGQIDNGAGDANGWSNSATTDTTSSKLEIIADYGVAASATTYASSTQFNHSANSTQTVTVAGNKNLGQMLGCMVANDQPENGYGGGNVVNTDGIRPRNGGFSGLPYQYLRFLNGDTVYGYNEVVSDGELGEQNVQVAEAGTLWINAYRLTAGADFQLDVSNGTEQTYRYYFAVYVRNLGAKDTPPPQQNVQTVSSTTGDVMGESQA